MRNQCKISVLKAALLASENRQTPIRRPHDETRLRGAQHLHRSTSAAVIYINTLTAAWTTRRPRDDDTRAADFIDHAHEQPAKPIYTSTKAMHALHVYTCIWVRSSLINMQLADPSWTRHRQQPQHAAALSISPSTSRMPPRLLHRAVSIYTSSPKLHRPIFTATVNDKLYDYATRLRAKFFVEHPREATSTCTIHTPGRCGVRLHRHL